MLAGAVAWTARGRARRCSPPTTAARNAATRERAALGEASARGAASPPAGSPVDTAEELARLRERLEQELAERRAEIARLEERILQREESLERRLGGGRRAASAR